MKSLPLVTTTLTVLGLAAQLSDSKIRLPEQTRLAMLGEHRQTAKSLAMRHFFWSCQSGLLFSAGRDDL
jgi:hypothetical protein